MEIRSYEMKCDVEHYGRLYYRVQRGQSVSWFRVGERDELYHLGGQASEALEEAFQKVYGSLIWNAQQEKSSNVA